MTDRPEAESPSPATPAVARAALIAAVTASFIGPFMGSSVNVALPSMGGEFGLGAVTLGWVNTAFLLAGAVFTVPFGRLGDIYGRKRIYWMGILVFTLASVVIALAQSGATLIAGRAVQGFGGSMFFATGMAILMSVYPARKRGRALGIVVAAVYLGLSTGPFIGGLITQHLGWRAIFWLNLPLGLLLLVIAFFLLPGDWTGARGARFDLKGAMILGASLFSTLYGFSVLPAVYGFVLLAAGVSGIAAFVAFELREPEPIVDVRMFRDNPVFAFSNLAALINYAATFAVTFLVSLYLQQVRGFSPQSAGTLLVVQPLVQAVLSPLAGRLSDRIEPRTVASAGMALTLIGLLMLAVVGRGTPIPYVAVCLALLGLGFALFSSPNTNAVMSSVHRDLYGVASGMLGTMRQLGMMVSMGVVMMMLSLKLGGAVIGPERADDFVGVMRVVFLVFAGLCFGGIFASLARGRMR